MIVQLRKLKKNDSAMNLNGLKSRKQGYLIITFLHLIQQPPEKIQSN